MLNFTLYTIISIGAFGMVYKGKLVISDGSVKSVAIKTIKCKYLNYVTDYEWI